MFSLNSAARLKAISSEKILPYNLTRLIKFKSSRIETAETSHLV